jgi:nucleobase:cation symporter-1, NCS1 family
MTGILISDYFLVRKKKLYVDDLYIGNVDSAYWFWGGFNWRAFAAWATGLCPLMRKLTPLGQFYIHPDQSSLAGFVRQVRGTASGSGWDHLYAVSYLFGFFVAFSTYWGLSALSPDKQQSGSNKSGFEPKPSVRHTDLTAP